ncbi:hypothetical protein WR25_22970 [Diploscapter pachys]|uniref:LRRCT domain-containing protein n=1 Tax=Diploscapter pachys TaxID=2018661 RepID=A0A2A2JM31_9BILA|nr:hypothetical protein WR25_22970 [Diploscapter pachys]
MVQPNIIFHLKDAMKRRMLDRSLFPQLLIFCLSIDQILSQCPPHLQDPCSCSSTRYEAVSIVCDKGESLSSVLLALSQPPAQIDSLSISNTPIDQLPGFAFQGFNIKKLTLRNNGLRAFHPEAFSGQLVESLEELEIKNNYLDTIPQEGITKLRNLRSLALTDNIIEYIPDNSFLSYSSRESIQKLDLSSNNMTAIHPTGLLGLESLSQLLLDKNLFHDIPTEALANIPTLEDLSMGVNQLTQVAPDSLPLPSLRSLSLEVNQIRQIPADSFQSLPGLTYLYLGNNLLTSIDPSMFFYTNNLKVLSMGNNKDITSISSNAFQHVPQLVRVELSDCSIAHIESSAFRKITKVQVLSLARNQLTGIRHDTFSNLPELVQIDLSGNAITHIDDFAFSQLPQLALLDLSSNRLESLPVNALYDSLLPKSNGMFRSLLLHNNPWRCDKDLMWLRKWLRENGDVRITASGAHTARCWSPSNLNGLDLRQTDPVKSKPAATQIIGDSMRKLIKPAENLFIPSQKPEFVESMPNEEPQISGASLVALVLGIVLSVLAVCLILLMIIRCIIKTQEKKERNSSLGGASDTSSRWAGSAYSGQGILTNTQARAYRSATNHNVYLNRPRYWWF